MQILRTVNKQASRSALVLGYYGYGSALIPEYQITMIGSLIYPSDKLTPDVILFTGGEDISPSIYKEINYACHGVNVERDKWEISWYRWALINKVPMVGICRGMQMFTVLTGGKLIQNALGHNEGEHKAITAEGEIISLNSIHHQICVPKAGTYELLAFATNPPMGYTTTPRIREDFESRFAYESRDNRVVMVKEPEALWFPEIRALGVQYHPEMLHKDRDGYKLFKSSLHKYIIKE